MNLKLYFYLFYFCVMNSAKSKVYSWQLNYQIISILELKYSQVKNNVDLTIYYSYTIIIKYLNGQDEFK